MTIRRAPLRVKILAAKERQVLTHFLRESAIAWKMIELIVERAPTHPGEATLRGSLSKSNKSELQGLIDLAQQLKEEVFIDLVTGRTLSFEMEARQEAEAKDTKRIRAWFQRFNEFLLSQEVDSARKNADNDSEVRRLTSLRDAANLQRGEADKRADRLRTKLAEARAQATGIILPQTETEWSVFWKINQS